MKPNMAPLTCLLLSADCHFKWTLTHHKCISRSEFSKCQHDSIQLSLPLGPYYTSMQCLLECPSRLQCTDIMPSHFAPMGSWTGASRAFFGTAFVRFFFWLHNSTIAPLLSELSCIKQPCIAVVTIQIQWMCRFCGLSKLSFTTF